MKKSLLHVDKYNGILCNKTKMFKIYKKSKEMLEVL